MEGLPVTIRLLDPPLHEFLPSARRLMVDIASLPSASAKQKKEMVEEYREYGAKGAGDLKKVLSTLLGARRRVARVQSHAWASRVPLGNYLSGNNRDAGASYL